MTPDPIVGEVRAIRDAIAQEHGYDIDAIFEAFRRMEETSGRPHVTPTPQNRGDVTVQRLDVTIQRLDVTAQRLDVT